MRGFRGRRSAAASVLAIGSVVLAGSAVAATSAPRLRGTPRHRALSAQRIGHDAKAVSGHVVVIMRNQHRTLLASASSQRARAAIIARERAPLLRQIRRSGGRVTRQFRVLNAFAATVSKAQASRLASNPNVAKVLPDTTVTIPRNDLAQGVPGVSPPSTVPPAPAPGSQICPTDPAKPLLEPEALQTTNTAFTDPSKPQAQNLATGKGVKVAFFADGIDVNNPDFIRPDGSHVFIDYQDFTGDGPNGVTEGAESFGDASSIAAQGRQVYDLSQFVTPAHPLPPGCTITVRGVAPGASLIGMKVFPNAAGAPSSMIVQGMDWAVSVDHADIISESFGGYPIPSTTADIIKAFNDQAVAMGVTVSQGSGDSGAQATPSPPADDPLVIDAGANTNFRLYAQTTSYGFQFSNGSYFSDNISSIGGGGISQNALVPDLVASGESGWSLCSPNTAIYQACVDNAGRPTGLLQFGGTSMATPLMAGAAALIIESYRSTHGGRTPSPALVKQILTSTANDLGLPSDEQGAGELDSLKAVQAARSVDGGQPTGHSLLIGPTNQLQVTGPAGSTPNDRSVSVTNTGATAQTVHAQARAITTTLSDQVQTVNLGTTPTFVDQFGAARPYVLTTFTVPAGADRLVAFDSWPGPDPRVSLQPNARVGLTLIDPNGTYTAYTRPQGNGNHGQVDVRKPVAGTWKALVFKRDGTYTGPVHLEFESQKFGTVDSVSPASQVIGPGQTRRFQVHLRLPSAPGDSSQDLVINSSTGDGTVVPIVLRSLINLGAHGGDFAGTIIGGNGRNGTEQVAQQNTFAFDVPRGRDVLSASLTFPDDGGTEVQGYLVDPGGNTLAAATTIYAPLGGGLQKTHELQAFRLAPRPGRWQLVVNITNPVGGNALSTPYRGHIGFDSPRVRTHGVPNGEKLKAGQPVTATISVRNPGPAIEDVFVDPRLGGTSDLALLPFSDANDQPLPGAFAFFVPPTQTSDVVGAANASAPIELELGFGVIGEGDPDIRGLSSGNSAAALYSAPEVSAGPWFVQPALRGPFSGPASGTADMGMLARTATFDSNVSSSTGDFEQVKVDPNAEYTPLTLQPGQEGSIQVTFTPQGPKGSVVRGTLYLDDLSNFLLFTNEQVAIPYRYRIG
jgi:subtilase family protein/peptidase inhibitor I9